MIDRNDSRPADVSPITACRGNAEVTYRQGRVTLDVGAHVVITSEAAARDLLACLAEVFDPLAETRRVAKRVAALAGDAQ